MKQIIKDVLDDMSNSQVNLGSSAARKMVSTLISTALESKGCYTEYDDSEIEEQNARATWVCSICGENTADVDYDYLGSGTNHLGCELKSQEEIDNYIEDIDEQAYAQGRGSSHRVVDDAGVDIKTGKYVGDSGVRREKNWLQKKHENKVFGGDTGTDADFGYDEIPEGLKRAKELSQEAIEEELKRQLSEEIVDNKDEKYIYESPDGGKTVFRRPFSDYDPKNKEEIDWKTKEPTGRKFTEYNNGNWRSEDEG
jgi:hypothetical protein